VTPTIEKDPPGRRPGATDDLDYIDRLLDTGCWVGMDRNGLDIFLPTERRNATVLALLEKGRAERMFLSQDYHSTVDWFPLEAQGYLRPMRCPSGPWSRTPSAGWLPPERRASSSPHGNFWRAYDKVPRVATDEWRVEIDLEDDEQHLTLGERIRSLDLDDEARRRLGDSVTVTRDGPRMFMYATTESAVREAERVARELIVSEGLSVEPRVTRWHPDEEAWRDAAEPLPQTEAEREAERARHEAAEARQAAREGVYDYEVHVNPPHHGDAVELERRLEDEGLVVRRRWKHLRVEALTDERANELAERIRAEAPEGTEVTIGATELQQPLFVLFGSAFDRLRRRG
jgi:Phosphotriesterase family